MRAMRIDELPIYDLLPDIADAIARGRLALSAETGAGKTSAVPAYLAARRALPGKILVLEPRRLAAVSAAARVAELLGSPLGDAAGYRVRGDSRAGRDTIVEFVTDAVFVRVAQDDPFLSGVSAVILDEFHERSAYGDLALAFALEAADARDGLSVAAMSATMDADAVAAYLGGPAIRAPGRAYPVDLAYRPPKPGERAEDAVASAIREALDATEGDVLAFLPGLREMDAVSASLGRLPGGSAGRGSPEVLTLHGSMPLSDQRRATLPSSGAGRRVILATNVAETSLTVPRITAVVDSGLTRLSRFHAPSGLNRLVTERASMAEADQRAGRAGRLGPGLCLRCWDASDILAPSRGPELARTELSAVALECAVRGSSRLEATRWLDEPPRHMWDAAVGTLRRIGLLDDGGRATESGRTAASLGTEPRAAAALLAAASDGGRPEGMHAEGKHAAALAAAALTERGDRDDDGDYRGGLERLLAAAGRGRVDDRGARILAEAGRLLSRLPGRPAFSAELAARALDAVGELLAPGFPDRLARRLADDSWEFPSGRRARSAYAPPRVAWLLALDADAGDPLGRIRRAAPVGERAAKAAMERGASLSLELEWRGLAASAWERKRFGVFALAERRLERAPRDLLATGFAERLRVEGLSWLPWNDEARSIVDRARYVAARGIVDPADWGDEAIAAALAADAADWLSDTGPAIDGAALVALLAARLGPDGARALDRAAPPFVETPGGRRRRPTYPAAGPARLAGRIQEFFGMEDGPRACGEPMTLELLSPADRPLQVTSDLAGFWRNAYPSIRAEMARRYPRHYWPADPLAAEPTRGQRPRPSA